jgi:hypothetical protein
MPETVNQEQQTNEQQQDQKTFTQDELNAIVSDRVKREREKHADYATLKEKADKLDQLEEASKSEIQKMTEKADRLQQELDQIKQAESIREMRSKVSKATGIPDNLLTGSTEEECTAQAEAIKAFAKPAAYPNVRDSGEVTNTNALKPEERFKEWFDATYKGGQNNG